MAQKAPLFPNFHDVRPSFIVGKLKDADLVGINPIRVIAQFDPVVAYGIDSYGGWTLPRYGKPVYIDMESRQPIDPDTFEKTNDFNPTKIAEATYNLQQEIAERDEKIKSLDSMLKTLTIVGDPRVIDANRRISSLQDDLRAAQQYGNEQRIRGENLYDDNKRLVKIRAEQDKELMELRAKVKKLTGDLLNTANERDNKVEELAKQKLPNLERDVAFYKGRAKELAARLQSLEPTLAEIRTEHDEEKKTITIAYERELRNLQRKLRKAGGRIRALNNSGIVKELIDARKANDELINKLETVNKAYKIERDATKSLMKQLQVIPNVPEPPVLEEAVVPPSGDRTVNITLNIASMTVAEMNNYS